MSKEKALDEAENQGLDLVMVAENDGKAICKLMNYSKFKYEQEKKKKKSVKHTAIKEIRIGWQIGEHDLKTKLNNAKKLMTKEKCEVKFVTQFRGRERTHIQMGVELLKRVFTEFLDTTEFEQTKSVRIEGGNVSMTVKYKH